MATQLVPSSSVQRQHGEGTSADLGADFLQMQVHGVDVGVRQHQPGAHAAGRTDGAEQIGPMVTLIARRGGSAAAFCPNAGQAALLTNAGFILPPQLDRLAARGGRDGSGNQVGEVFLCASCAAASA
jgi:hypothetical protein